MMDSNCVCAHKDTVETLKSTHTHRQWKAVMVYITSLMKIGISPRQTLTHTNRKSNYEN